MRCALPDALCKASDQHKPAAADLGQLSEAHGAVKGFGFRRIVRCKLDLPHVFVLLQNGAKQRGADALALIFREHQKILHEHDGLAVADHTDQAQKLRALICGQRQQRTIKAAPQRLRLLGVGRPADAGIQTQNFVLALFSVFLDLHGNASF